MRKLAGMLPGTDEELIKSCITELRAKHGKLSGNSTLKRGTHVNVLITGWPTSKIATHIVDMMKENSMS